MIEITVYELSTGRISRTINAGRIEDAMLNVNEGESTVPGYVNAEQYYIVSGLPVEYPPKPGPWASFDYTNGIWVDPRTPVDVENDLSMAKSDAVALINTRIGAVRRQFVTDIPGQEMLYLRKEAEAVRWLSETTPNLIDYPLISAEIGITGEDADQIAQVWVNMADLWSSVAAQLETLRLGYIAQVEGAADQAGIEAALAEFQQAMESMT